METTVQTFGETELRGLFAALRVAPHPMLKLPALDWVQDLIRTKPQTWKAELVAFLNRRNERIRMAEEDPLWHGWEFEPWKDADGLLNGTYTSPASVTPAEAAILGIFGGNRASKTVYAVRRACQTGFLFPGSRIALCSESVTASIATLEALVWYYFKPHFHQYNGKRNEVFKINYTQANGWADRKLVLPNGSEFYFLTYGQDPGDYEGWEFGAPAHLYDTLGAELRAKGQFVPPNIGAVCDESMPLAWLKMFSRRLKFRRAKLLWPFTPVKGITPSIKELMGAATLVESRPAELVPAQKKNFPDVPAGHMPYIRECVYPGVKAMAIYFFTEFNKFGPGGSAAGHQDRTYYQEVKALCEGKTSEYIERVAYGVARDTVARAFPKFGPWNIVKRIHLPARGTNYFFTDPAGARNWASFWVRVVPSPSADMPTHYIYRDWPDCQTYGEWAVPTEREVNDQNRGGWDGDPGPAQTGLGFGIVKYKRTFLECERIVVPKGAVNRAESPSPLPSPAGRGGMEGPEQQRNEDPYRARRVQWALARGGFEEIYEEIAERYVDSRASKSEHIAEQGGTCITEEFEEVQYDSKGQVTGPSMELLAASGVNEDEGLTAVNELLDWNQEEPLMPILNAPRLYVCEDAMQVIWCMENFTGRGGAKGASKDFADLLRYMALAKLTPIEGGQASGRKGGGF